MLRSWYMLEVNIYLNSVSCFKTHCQWSNCRWWPLPIRICLKSIPSNLEWKQIKRRQRTSLLDFPLDWFCRQPANCWHTTGCHLLTCRLTPLLHWKHHFNLFFLLTAISGYEKIKYWFFEWLAPSYCENTNCELTRENIWPLKATENQTWQPES